MIRFQVCVKIFKFKKTQKHEPAIKMSVEEKMKKELIQVEAQIYDLETIFLSNNRYGAESFSSTAATEQPSSDGKKTEPAPVTPNKSFASISNDRRIFSKTSNTSSLEKQHVELPVQ